MKYLQISPKSKLPELKNIDHYRAVVIIEESVTPDWRHKVSRWLVNSGCVYMMAWGETCRSWDDSVDNANLEVFNYGEIPEDKFVLTTWHDDEPLKEVFWFSKNCAFHPDVEINDTILLHISNFNKEKEYLSEYANV